jgi:hypothetical protein
MPAAKNTQPERPQIVTVEWQTSVNEYLAGDVVDLPLDERTTAYVDRGWVDVVGVDGFELPRSR